MTLHYFAIRKTYKTKRMNTNEFTWTRTKKYSCGLLQVQEVV